MKFLSIPALACAMTLGFGLASAQSIAPTRVGPVSQYGQLMTGKNSAGEGRIYGSCQGVKDGAEVQVRGMSLFWSMINESIEYWTEEGIASMVKDMNIQIVRAAMGTNEDDWWGCKDGSKECGGQNDPRHIRGYVIDKEFQTNLMKTVVEAAIKQDIYVIIDWHSHNADKETDLAKGFFKEMAQTYGQYDNVIFELFNEPIEVSWSQVKTYAEAVIPSIRENSDNLILIGNRFYDQHPEEAINSPINDDNTAYTFHYYANSHCYSGMKDGNNKCEGENAVEAIKAGLSVFVSEWGTGNADGGGDPGSANIGWQQFMDTYKLSWANWSASHKSEGTAAFQNGSSNKNNLVYTASGNMVKGFLATNPTTYTACPTGGNQGGQLGIASFHVPSALSVNFSNKVLQISGVNAANVELFDMKGHKLMMIDGVSGNLSLASLPAGQYIVRVKAGSASKMQAVSIK